jgi:pyridoxal phosphate enzyme (YggS family)
MAELIRGLEPAVVRANLARVREAAGQGVRVLVATKYVADEELPALADAGVELVGENRLQDLERKQAVAGDRFEWHFIGALQSRKVRDVVPRVSLIHSVCTDSVLDKLGAHAPPETEVLVQVNVAGEESKAGVAPENLGDFIARCPVRVAGLMTMPPFTDDPEASRPYFARLAELATEHSLSELSMGTSQDWEVAVAEGATLIRLGNVLLKGQKGS